MTLRNQLKNVKILNSETIQPYFTRVAQIKEQLEAVEEKVGGEIVKTTLNGLPRSWNSFIQGICARKKLITFNILWEECTQEEAWLIIREEKMGATKDKYRIVHTRKNYKKKENRHYNKKKDKKKKKFRKHPSNM